MLMELLQNFVKEIQAGTIEVYNEFSVQHELGIYLRNHLSDYKVQFERNIHSFDVDEAVKKEIDIVVYNDEEKYAIELKYPRNGQYPEQMYSFVKDICFMEEMKAAGFDQTYCLTLVDNHNFYRGKKQDGIYAYFRCGKKLCGTILKPTGDDMNSLTLRNEYQIVWESCQEMKYYIIAI